MDELDSLNRDQGFAAGDRALQRAATAFAAAVDRTPGAVAARTSGRRFAVLVPGEGHGVLERIAAELADGPRVRLARATWREGDSGEDVLARARLGLRGQAVAGSV
jgi:GGDEF domain-containing protein